MLSPFSQSHPACVPSQWLGDSAWKGWAVAGCGAERVLLLVACLEVDVVLGCSWLPCWLRRLVRAAV